MTGDEAKNGPAILARDMLALDLPADCVDGVEANLRLLAGHARILESWLDRAEEDAP